MVTIFLELKIKVSKKKQGASNSQIIILVWKKSTLQKDTYCNNKVIPKYNSHNLNLYKFYLKIWDILFKEIIHLTVFKLGKDSLIQTQE